MKIYATRNANDTVQFIDPTQYWLHYSRTYNFLCFQLPRLGFNNAEYTKAIARWSRNI